MQHADDIYEKKAANAIEKNLQIAANVSAVVIGLFACLVALHLGKTIIAPIALAIVIGIMFGPIADRIEKSKIRPSISAMLVVALFAGLILASFAAFAVPMSSWMDRVPRIWNQFQISLADWKGMFETVGSFQQELQKMAGGEATAMKVEVDESGPFEEAAFLAPVILGQIAIFLASFYFFVATRHDLRLLILKLCVRRKTRWHVARIFKDVEDSVSGYLISITYINLGMGITVSLLFWLIGVPSPFLWGMLAGVLNYVVYIGPAVMSVILIGVGLATHTETLAILTPAAVFLGVNFLEAQFITPTIIGRRTTMNPFFVFLSLVFWIWLWGPAGGFIAIPSLLITNVIYLHMFVAPQQRRQRARF
ncbi:AI-2E family transporter [Ahrensia sp. 13_GOM-1096m]|uniref:AI-2E family transporter n=1 Tax=Ahrensia sp. 13_GOM-1096m TaxID=1380380 RepID=UPI00047C6623|nr:AI-2E family transporter [Ahrensia sp. 13_GOM-1096m]